MSKFARQVTRLAKPRMSRVAKPRGIPRLAPHQPRHVLACLAPPPRHALLGCPAAYQGDDDDEAQMTAGGTA